MHLQAAGKPARDCGTCGTSFVPRRSWGAFCSTRCRNAFHGAEKRNKAIASRAVPMYLALAEIAKGMNDPIGVNYQLAAEAIKDLKPPVEPKDLLEKAKA